MIQLVEVQHRRGVRGGKIFANTIKNLDPELPSPPSPSAKPIPLGKSLIAESSLLIVPHIFERM